MDELNITTMAAAGYDSEAAVLSKRPYIATHGRHRGQSVIAVNTGQLDAKGNPRYAEKPIHTNATLRKDEWLNLEDRVIEAAQERYVILDDMRSAGLTYNVGGLGTIVSEWETQSDMTDAEATMDGESTADKDRIQYGLNGVPIPVIQKPWKIGERVLMASRQRGSALDVSTGVAAARSVARKSEDMIFNGLPEIGANGQTSYRVHGLLTFPGRAQFELSNWADGATTTRGILDDVLAMLQYMETEERSFGPYNLYIPAAFAYRMRQDYSEQYGNKTLMERLMDLPEIANIRISDVLPNGNAVLVRMDSSVLDLAVASDVTTVQWASGSGWVNHFQTFAAWAPRFKSDFDGHTGILHAAVA